MSRTIRKSAKAAVMTPSYRLRRERDRKNDYNRAAAKRAASQHVAEN